MNISSEFSAAQIQQAASILGVQPDRLSDALKAGSINQPTANGSHGYDTALFVSHGRGDTAGLEELNVIPRRDETQLWMAAPFHLPQSAPTLSATDFWSPHQAQPHEYSQVTKQRLISGPDISSLGIFSDLEAAMNLEAPGGDWFTRSSEFHYSPMNPHQDLLGQAGFQYQYSNSMEDIGFNRPEIPNPIQPTSIQANDSHSQDSLSLSLTLQSRPASIPRWSETRSRAKSSHLPLLAPRPSPRAGIGERHEDSVGAINFSVERQERRHAINRIKKRPFQTSKLREETSLTRRLKSCVRCRMQRIRCLHDPTDAAGPCLSCQGITFGRVRLPCLRYKITDSTLYRTAFNHYDFFRVHVMIGPTYGDFHLDRDRKTDDIRVLEVAQDSGAICRLKIREFVPSPDEEDVLDTRGNKMYAVPWAIANADDATEAINSYIDESIGTYLDYVLDDSNHLVWDVFQCAFRLSMFPTPVSVSKSFCWYDYHSRLTNSPNLKILSEVLRVWVVCRFFEGRWRCCGYESFGSERLSHHYSDNDFVQIPPYINYQMAALFTQRILEPLCRSVLNTLQTMVLANKPSNWYTILLAVFILLHNYELQISFQRAFAARRKFPVRFVEMSTVRAIHSGSKTILAHFHYCCKGQRPFRRDFDWSSPQIKRMAQLDSEQVGMLKRYSALVERQAPLL